MFAGFLLLFLVLSFFIIRPFLAAILAAVVIAYIFYPVYKFLNKYIKRESVTALIVSVFIILLLTAPLVFIGTSLSKDIGKLYFKSKQRLSGNVFDIDCDSKENLGCGINAFVTEKMSDPTIRNTVYTSIIKVSDFLLEKISDLLISIPIILLNIFITLFITYYLFKDGKKVVSEIRQLMPFKEKLKTKLFAQTKGMFYATVYGTIVVAIIQGSLAGIAFLILDSVSSPLFWGIITIIAALIPFVGSALVWFPIAVLQILNGYFSGSSAVMVKGLVLLIFGFAVVSTIDNILKPKIIGKRAKLHPVFVLLGVLGGLIVFGFIGVIIGPLVIALLVSFLEVYKEEKRYIC